jgi:dienelactone hydrolase
MKKYILCGLLIGISVLYGVLNGEVETPQTGGPFEATGVLEKSKADYKYWMYVPEEYTSNRSWPLMVILHGSGDRASNIITAYTNEAKNNRYILAAINAQDPRCWTDLDDPFILGTIENVQKSYNIDSDRVFLAGFSAGGFKTCGFGFSHRSLFRGLAPAGAALPDSCKNISDFTVLIVCGDKDPNYARCKSVYAALQKQKIDTDLDTLPDVGHTLTQEGVTWIFDGFRARLNQPDALMARGKKALAAKHYLDALDCYNKVVADTQDAKDAKSKNLNKTAQDKIKEIDKIASNKYNQALADIKDNKKDAASKLLNEIVNQFEGTSVYTQVQDKLKELTAPPAAK